ncbi:hypothetical protein GCM10027578_10100 [Spirosoma luteolum]
MNEQDNPFKHIESDAVCPPELKKELVSEIDIIRNALKVVEVYAHDIFPVFTTFLSGFVPTPDSDK